MKFHCVWQVLGKRIHYKQLQALLDGQDLSLYRSHGATEILTLFTRATAFLKKLRQIFFGCSDYGPPNNKNPSPSLLEVLCPRRMKKLTGVVVPPVGRGRKRPEVVGEIAREQPPEKMVAVDCPEKQAVAEKTHPLDLDLDNEYAFTDMVS